MPEMTEGAPLALWRAFVPRWAFQPLSGEGAARFGGRWNPAGEAALYAACEMSTAWAEYNQGFVQHPALIVQLELWGARLADLTNAELLVELGLDDKIHQCEWRADIDRGLIPETYRVRDVLMEKGYHGIIYPSYMSHGGTCVALWRWNEGHGPSLTVIDPEGRLPKSEVSWL